MNIMFVSGTFRDMNAGVNDLEGLCHPPSWKYMHVIMDGLKETLFEGKKA